MNLENSCRQFVEFKFALDDKLEARRKSSNGQNETNVYAVPPFRFVEYVIPFWTLESREDPIISFVDADLVIGGTYKKFEEGAVEKCCEINDDDWNIADYEKIGDLPLYVAIEGKNRVRLFQKHRIPIKARVTKIAFPLQDELQLHRYGRTNDYFLSCSNDFYVRQNNQQVPLLYPEITVPLFKNYGVKEGKPIRNIFPINKDRLKLQQALESINLY